MVVLLKDGHEPEDDESMADFQGPLPAVDATIDGRVSESMDTIVSISPVFRCIDFQNL